MTKAEFRRAYKALFAFKPDAPADFTKTSVYKNDVPKMERGVRESYCCGKARVFAVGVMRLVMMVGARGKLNELPAWSIRPIFNDPMYTDAPEERP